MKTLIICDHPHYDQSLVNRRWLDEVRKYPDDFLVHNLQSSYPTGVLDTAKEHNLLSANGSVVLQFPLYWFNSPPFLKKWFDIIMNRGWAFGEQYSLEGKKIALAVTCGGKEESFSKQGRNGASVEEFLNSYIRSIAFLKAEYAGLFCFYGANDVQANVDTSMIANSARDYVDFLHSFQV